MTRLRNHFDRELILLLIFSIFAVAALLSPGFFFRAHDADHTVFYLIEFDASIRDGILWPRWSPDHAMGYGYPFWVVYAPLAYFAAEVFHLLGVGFTASIKIVMALSALFGGWGMYALLRRWWGRNGIGRGAALVGGLVYVYAPYHLLTVYVRAAFAEYVAMAWFPWVILAFDDVVEWGGLRRIALAALALGALFLTHSATLMVFTPLLAIYLLFALVRKTIRQRREQESWRQVIGSFAQVVAAGLLAIGLAAIFLLPLAAEQGAKAVQQARQFGRPAQREAPGGLALAHQFDPSVAHRAALGVGRLHHPHQGVRIGLLQPTEDGQRHRQQRRFAALDEGRDGGRRLRQSIEHGVESVVGLRRRCRGQIQYQQGCQRCAHWSARSRRS